jgi:hypothetical protein
VNPRAPGSAAGPPGGESGPDLPLSGVRDSARGQFQSEFPGHVTVPLSASAAAALAVPMTGQEIPGARRPRRPGVPTPSRILVQGKGEFVTIDFTSH